MAESGSSTVEEKSKSVAENEQNKEKAEVANEEPLKEMRAVVLTGFGGLKSVKVMKKPEPTVGEGEVLIRVKACGLNFQDLMVRQGAIDSPPKTPFILGFECAGEITALGAGVTDFQVGDLVIALTEYKGWAELVAVSSKYIYKLPSGMTCQDAVAVTLSGVVAYVLLFELGGISQGKSVLLHSAGGGVGQAVAQLCKTVPDIVLFGIASKGKHEAIKDSVTHLLERGTDFTCEVRKVAPEGVDLVLDCLCGEECNRSYSLLRPMGKYILFGSSNIVTGETKSFFSVAKSWWQVDKVSPIKLFDENKTLSGFNLRHLLYQQNGVDYVRNVVNKVFQLYQQGKIKPVIDSTWAMEDVPEAMQKMHDRKNVGKVILDPAMEPKPKPATPAKGKLNKDEKNDVSAKASENEKPNENEVSEAANPASPSDSK